MTGICQLLTRMAVAPSGSDAYAAWLEQRDVLSFLADNATSDEIVIYAGLPPHVYVHGVLVPRTALDPLDPGDLLSWNGLPYSSWSEVSSADKTWIKPPLAGINSKAIAQGEQLVFVRSFDGVPGYNHYIEILQKMTHLTGLHFMSERSAWCRLDRHGDIADMIRVVKIEPEGEFSGGHVVLFRRKVLEEYAALTDSLLLCMFEFQRFRPSALSGGHSGEEQMRSEGDILLYRYLLIPGHASYTRGVYITDPAVHRRTDEPEEKRYATFIAEDSKNKRITEISCDPAYLVDYFSESDLPFAITPAFFRPEVLLKYKSDRDKYKLESRSISCRGSWHLQTYDVNEAGQVHTYLIYLSRLPYEEQLHWKQYNEHPKGPIAKRAFTTDIEGKFDDHEDPLEDLKRRLDRLRSQSVPWWSLRSSELPSRAQYPVTASADEWKDEILTLDQLVVEGFEEKWLRRKAQDLGLNPDARSRLLRLLEDCLIGLGFEAEHAHEIVAPLCELHRLRSIVKGHAAGKTAQAAQKAAVADHGSLREHY